MSDTIRVFLKRPGEKGFVPGVIPNTLEGLQKAVGGNIETLTLPGGVVAILNEAGRLEHMPYNFSVMGIDLVGPVVLAGVDGPEFADVPLTNSKHAKAYIQSINRFPVPGRRGRR